MTTRHDTRRTALDRTASDRLPIRATSFERRTLAIFACVTLGASTAMAATAPRSVTGSPGGDAFNMSEVSTSVAENGGSVTLTVLRQGAGVGSASVDYSTQNISAMAPQDYTTVAGTLMWADGDLTPQTVTIPIIDDAIHQGNLSLNFALTNPQGASLGVLPSEGVTIVDDETGAVAQAIPAPMLDAFGHTLLGGLLALVALVAMRRHHMR